MTTPTSREPSWLVIAAIIALALVGAGYYVISARPSGRSTTVPSTVTVRRETEVASAPAAFARFTGSDEARAWLATATSSVIAPEALQPSVSADAGTAVGTTPDRLAVDGQRLLYAPSVRRRAADAADPGTVHLMRAWPIETVGVEGQLARGGDLLVSGDTAIVFATDGLHAYDIADLHGPKERWVLNYGLGQTLRLARLLDDELYLVIGGTPSSEAPCPVRPLEGGTRPPVISCADVWHQGRSGSANAVLSLVVLDPSTGQTRRALAATGADDSLRLTLTSGRLYLTVTTPADETAMVRGFLEDSADLVPATTVARVRRLDGYELTAAARRVELDAAVAAWLGALDAAGRRQAEVALSQRLDAYWKVHRHEAERTEIMAFDRRTLQPAANGTVAGRLLGPGALDEDGGNVRLAVTVGAASAGLSRFARAALPVSADVYVLDGRLRQVGAVMEAGRGAAVTGVRFLGAHGFVSTEPEDSPMLVLDLAKASAPALSGTLQLPSGASYLHPISGTRLLAVGRDGSQARLVLYDLQPAVPVELARYGLGEFWPDVQGTHAAFAMDAAREAFFLPGSKGGYLMSLAGDRLSMIAPVTGVRVSRAATVQDLLYLVGDAQAVTYSELTWRRIIETSWVTR